MASCLVDCKSMTWVLVALIILSLLTLSCCVCIKIRDMKQRSHIRKLAKRRGILLGFEQMYSKQTQTYPCSALNDNCTIMIPDVAIVM